MDGRRRKIRKLFDYPLRAPIKEIEHKDLKEEWVEQIIADLKENLMFSKKGVGLAAPQIGYTYRIFIAVDEIFINPEITGGSEEEVPSQEGCLSLPGASRTIMRKKEIQIRYIDEKREQKLKKFKGFKAIVIQHEFDHLEGKLICDY